MEIKTVLKYETSEAVGDAEERINKTYHCYMSESSSSKDEFSFRSAENAAYPTFVCGSRKGKSGRERPEIIFGKRVCIEFRIKKKNEKPLVDVATVNGWHKFLPVPLYSVLLLICGIVLPPIVQYVVDLGNETPFSWGPLFHLVVFGLCFGSAFILDALTRLSVPREDPIDALNRFAEYLVSDIPNPKKSCGVIFLLLLKQISRVSSDTRQNFLYLIILRCR